MYALLYEFYGNSNEFDFWYTAGKIKLSYPAKIKVNSTPSLKKIGKSCISAIVYYIIYLSGIAIFHVTVGTTPPYATAKYGLLQGVY